MIWALLYAAVSIALVLVAIGLWHQLFVRDRMHYLAIDPGSQNTGWAMFAKDGSDLGMGKVTGGVDKFMDWLEGLDPQPKEIILEIYRAIPGKNPFWKQNYTEQVIGAIKRHARRKNITIHEQPNTALPIGLRYCGFYAVYYDSQNKKLKHVDDQVSAYAHGWYYLQTKGIKKPRVANNG